MAVKFHDYYETLGAPRSATEDQVKRAYRKLARKFHPDVNPGDKSAEDRFKEINEAYEVLSDPEKRRRYDELGADWKAGRDFTPPPGAQPFRMHFGAADEIFGGGERFGGFSDFFQSLFGGGPFGRAGRPFASRGADLEAEVSITLEEAHRGTTRSISAPSEEACPECGGTGRKDNKVCPACRGTGVQTRVETFTADIPRGVQDGSVIRVPGRGGVGPGGSRGDLFLRVRIQPHERFRLREDGDIELELPITPWEAVLGANVRVPTLDGSVQMSIPPNSQSGRILRLRNKGLARQGGGRGDQYVRLKIVVPPQPAPKEVELMRTLAAESHFNPRESWR